jgi:tetratricopeptide (TPR) repeat protein
MLVQPYADGRLVLHEMVRQFALRKLMEDKTELRDASLSHAEHYVQLLAQSAEHIKYGSARDEIAHLSTEFENMMAAWNTLLAERRADWFDLCWEGIWFFFNITSRFREGETLFRSATASFGIHEMRLEETHVRDFSLVLAACFLMRRARISDASSVLADPQIGAIRSSEIPLDRFYFSSIQSYIFHAMGDAQAALAAAEVALDASRSLEKDFFAQVTTYFQIGRVYSLLGNSTLAHEYLSDSLRLFKEYRIGWGADLVVTEMGIVAETSGRIEEALAYYEAVLAGVTEWEEAWNYHRTRISIARLKFGSNHTQEALEILQATLQSLDKNPQLGLEIDCFVEIALVLKHYNETPLAYVLLEYCSTHPDCFHSTRDRAVAYLSTIKTEVPAIQVTLARNLFPHNKNEVLELLLDHLSKIRSSFASQ